MSTPNPGLDGAKLPQSLLPIFVPPHPLSPTPSHPWATLQPPCPALYKEDDLCRLYHPISLAPLRPVGVGQWQAPTRDGRVRERGWGIFPNSLSTRTYFLAIGILPPPSCPHTPTVAPVRWPLTHSSNPHGVPETSFHPCPFRTLPTVVHNCVLAGSLLTPLGKKPFLRSLDPSEADSVSCWALTHDRDVVLRWVLGTWAS